MESANSNTIELPGGAELILTPDPRAQFGKPIVVVGATIMEYARTAIARSEQLTVTTDDEFKLAAAFLNELGKVRSSIKSTALDLGRPFREEAARITAEATRVISPIEAAEERISGQMQAHKDRQAAARVKALQEAEARQREAARLTVEANTREAAALQKLDTAKTEKQFEAGATDFDVAVGAHDAAATAGTIASDILAAAPEPPKAKGVREIKYADILTHNLEKLPLTYHMINEVKAKKHILDGTITPATPGITFRIRTGFSGSGR